MSKPGDVLKHSVGTPPATTFPGGINAKQFGVLSPTTSALIGTILANAGETLIATKDAGGSYAPMVEGAAAKEGSGPLTNLSSVGVFNSLANVTTKHLGQVDDDPAGTWRRVGSVNAANKIVNASVDSAAAVDGSKLKEGSGPLTHLSSGGVVDNLTSVGATSAQRRVDDLGDDTYARVLAAATSSGKINLAAGGPGLANQLPTAQLADGAVTTPKIASGAINAQQMQSATIVYSVFANPTLVQRTRG